VWRTVFTLCIGTGLKWKHTQFTVLLWHSITLPQMVPTTCMQFATVPTSKFLCLIAPSPQVLISRHSSLLADYNLPFWPGQMMRHTVTLCFSAHVGNNLAVVIITHLPRSWDSSASIVARLWPQNSKAGTRVFSLLQTVHSSSGAQPTSQWMAAQASVYTR
jgi:hypothetical protein